MARTITRLCLLIGSYGFIVAGPTAAAQVALQPPGAVSSARQPVDSALGDAGSSDADGDSFPAYNDCDDQDASIYPDADEVPYDDIDQDCDGEDLADLDWDGYDATEAGGTDCDDQDGNVHPDAYDYVYDGIDQDCNGVDDVDFDDDGYASEEVGGADCDDYNAGVHPGAEDEAYDWIDQDCDGSDFQDVDGDGYDNLYTGGTDCDDSDPSIYPGADEVAYDEVDQDCDWNDLSDVDGDGQWAQQVGGSDCDDNDASIHAGAEEIPYDGIDQDCDGGDRVDADWDGYAASVVGGPDCDDEDAAIHPGAYDDAYDGIDQDCDGEDLADFDGDGYDSDVVGGSDCDDYDSSIHPGAEEVAKDWIDQDCDGSDLQDVDGDGYDDLYAGGSDCDDADPSIHPGAREIACDGVDQDCNWTDSKDINGDGKADDCSQVLTDADGDGYVAASSGGDDCDDSAASVHPGAAEVAYDGIDQDCSGADLTDVDGDGYAAAVAGGTDCDDGDATVHPGGLEVCDGRDNSCDAAVDEGVQSTYYLDADGDGHGDSAAAVQACSLPAGYSADAIDCDDADADVYPGAPPLCDGVDNDCDGQMDVVYFDSDLDTAVDTSLVQINGNASQQFSSGDGYLRLTPNATYQKGSVFLKEGIPADWWYAAFRFQIYGGSGADGITLSFLDETDPTKLGYYGWGLGVKGLVGNAVTFDTWHNPELGETSENHVDLMRTQNWNRLAYTNAVPELENTGEFFAEAYFIDGTIDVFLDGEPVLSYTYPDYTSTGVLLGWTGSTGGATNIQVIDDVLVGCL